MALAMTLVVGCSAPTFRPADNSEFLALDAQDVVAILSAAGFDDSQIVKKGRDFRNLMAQRGAAVVKDGGHTEAIFTIKGGLVHISTLDRGSYIYDPSSKTIN